MLDIVDGEDRVIDRVEKEEAHRLGLRHLFVQVLVLDGAGRVLLQQRSRTKARGPLLFDASVGGHVDAGEGYAEAARREAWEEIGLPRDGVYEPLGTILDETPGVENMVGRLFLHRSEGPFIGWEAEAERLEWFDPDELRHMTARFPYLFTGGVLSSIALLLGPA